MAKEKVMVNRYTHLVSLRAIFIRVVSITIKQMVKVHILVLMVVSILETGRMIKDMVKEN